MKTHRQTLIEMEKMSPTFQPIFNHSDCLSSITSHMTQFRPLDSFRFLSHGAESISWRAPLAPHPPPPLPFSFLCRMFGGQYQFHLSGLS